MSAGDRNERTFVGRIAMAMTMATMMLACVVSSAVAAPGLEVELVKDQTTVGRSDERIDYRLAVTNTGSSPTDGGLVTAELDLPSGTETYVYKTYAPDNPANKVGAQTETDNAPEGWTCASQAAAGSLPAKAICTRTDVLAPGASYPAIYVAAALGADAPDSASATARVSGGGSTPSSATDLFVFGPALSFGISAFSTSVKDESGADETRAGRHPFSATAEISLDRRRVLAPVEPFFYANREPFGDVKDVKADIPAGFIGNPEALPELCETTVLLVEEKCPDATMVGEVAFQATGFGRAEGNAGNSYQFVPKALYAMEPETGTPAQFAFSEPFLKTVYVLTPRLRPDGDYALSIDSTGITSAIKFMDFYVLLCGYGATKVGVDPVECLNADDPGAPAKPLLRNPTECSQTGPVTTLHVNTWQEPGNVQSAEAVSPLVTECDQVPFTPTAGFEPTSSRAESPTGLDVSIEIPTDGLEEPEGVSQSDLKKAVVKLPPGMSVNTAAADGLGACTQEQLGMVDGVPSDDPVECPDSSKIGSAEIVTPLLEEPLQGSVYLAKQGDNPFGTLLGLYLVVESKERGILVKIPGEVKIEPNGQIVSTFAQNPQVPFSSLKLHFNSGNRASLINPPVCGKYGIDAALSPWANPNKAVLSTSPFEVSSGAGGGACPNSPQLRPKFVAGLTNPIAGSTSSFQMGLSRDEGTERFSALDLTLPPGLTAYLRGIPSCPDAVLASIPTAEGTGAAELDNPSCPAASQLGSVTVGVGGGSNPFYVNTAKAYLAGPYKGAPLSIAVVAPAVAGPFDLGNVVIRNGAYVNPKTAQITVKSDPIPTALHGIPLNVRDIRISIDRPAFMLAPTNCELMSLGAQVRGEKGGSAFASNRFQVGNCGNLGFKPDLKLRLKGGTKRDKYQQLTATLTARPGDANIAGASVRFPQSIFLAQEHIGTVCTRVQFAADSCPPRSIYGYAEAVTPLLDQPLVGPVYLRSSDNVLPDLVAALRGPDNQPVEVELVGRTDSKNLGLRNTFDVVPDAPVSKFTLRMLGGKKSLLVTSRNLCLRKERAVVKMRGQNGMARNFRPVIQTGCKKQKPKKAQRNKNRR